MNYKKLIGIVGSALRFFLIIPGIFYFTSCGAPQNSSLDSDGVGENEHRIFITSQSFSPDWGELTQADVLCNQVASDAGLKRDYKALLSTANEDANNRFFFKGSIFVVLSNVKTLVVAQGAELFKTDRQILFHEINGDEKGQSLVGKTPWTGTTSEGVVHFDHHCDEWTDRSAAFNATVGSSDDDNGTYLENTQVSCSEQHPIICVSQ